MAPFFYDMPAASARETVWRRCPVYLISIVFFCLMLLAAPLMAQTDQPQNFSIPPQPLTSALDRFSRQTGIAFAYTTNQFKGVQSPGVSGRLTPRQALAQLLKGTGVSYDFTGATTVVLERLAANEKKERGVSPINIGGESRYSSDLPEEYAGGQVARGGHIGLLGNQNIFSTPFSVTNYTSELIENQQARELSDIVRNDSSTRPAFSSQGNGEAFRTRGFASSYLYDGLAVLYTANLTIRTLERVEIFKGPNALLSGVGAVGGMINLVPKRPTENSFTKLTTDYDYPSRFGIHTDLSHRFGSKKQFGARLNTFYHKGESTFEDNEEEFSEVALALEYNGDRFKLETILDYHNRLLDGGTQLFVLDSKATSVPSAPDLEDAIQQPWERTEPKYFRALFKTEYNLGKDWTMHATYIATDYKSYWLRTAGVNLDGNGDFNIYADQRSEKEKSYFWNAGIRGQFKTGEITHQVSVETKLRNQRFRRVVDRRFISNISNLKSNLYNPISITRPQFDRITRNPPKIFDDVISSTAIADNIGFLDERVLLTVGIRRQNYKIDTYKIDTYDKSANTPAIGLLVKPWSFMSLYGNYIEALEQGPTAPRNTVNEGEVFPPTETEQIEFGVKFDLDGLGLTAGLFQIEKPSGITENRRFSVDGEKRNRGLELNAFGELGPKLRLLGGITYIDSELTRTEGGKFDGNDAPRVPELMAVLSLEWDAPVLPGLTFTAHAEHMGSQYVSADNNLKIPSYELYGVGARYKRMISDQQFTFRMNIENLFNKDYWIIGDRSSFLSLGGPRRVSLSMSMNFF